MKQFKRSKLSMLITSACLIGGSLSIQASAEEAADGANEEVERISITGSRIQRVALTAKTPVIELDGSEFAMSGNLNVEQKLAELPLTVPSFGPSSNNPGDGTARVDLRGLGNERTLVLVNGRRWVPATQTGVVDLNTIPASLIEGVDIITGGAGAVYGSDALAGVVNFRLKDDFEGAEISALYDITEEGDGEKFNTDLTLGGNFADGKGNATVYLGYAKRESIFQGDRDFTNVTLTEGDTGLVPGGSSGIPGTRVFSGPTLPNGTTLGRFGPNGEGLPYTSADAFNYAPDNYLQLPQERLTLNSFAHYYINDETRLYSELSFIRNEVPSQLAPTPAFVGNLEVNPNSPFFGADVQAAMNALVPELDADGEPTGNMISALNADGNYVLPFIGRRMVENGPRQSIDTRNAMRLLVGVDGFIGDWAYNAYYSRSELDRSNLLNNDVSETRFRQAILVTDDGSACQDTSGGCAPLNIFGEGNISQAAIDFINVGASNVTNIKQEIFHIDFAGELPFTVPSADMPIGFVVGYESRFDDSSFRPDEFLASGDVLGFNAGEPTVGSYSVDEIFTEIDIPLVTDAAFAEDITLWFAGRLSDYSNIGNASSFATTLNWKVNEYVSFRAGYQESVRAPNIAELFQGAANGFPSATDPCSVDGFVEGTTDRALCEAHGVASSQVGVFEQANAQIEGSFGGNPELKEETSETVTLGLVITPTENFDVTVDYFDIQIDDAIDVLGGGVNNILDICYNQLKDPSSEFCQAITRRPDGNVDLVTALNANIAELGTKGYDINFNWTTELGFGIGENGSTLNINSKNTILEEYFETPSVGFTDTNYCEGKFGNTCGTPRPEFQSNNRFTWTSGDLSVSALVRYLSEVDDDTGENEIVPTSKALWYLDLSASYHFTDHVQATFGIKNVLDTEPTPLGDAQQQANTFPELYDVIGPRYFVSAVYTF